MKPIFTLDAGEYLVGSYIEHRFRAKGYEVWVPSKDTGVDLLVTNRNHKKAVALQVKFSKDYIPSMRNALHRDIQECGWFKPNTEKLEESQADFWVFALHRFNHKELDYVILPPNKLLTKLRSIHGVQSKVLQSYIWVTKEGKCWETRGLKRIDQDRIADGSYENAARDLTPFLNKWSLLESKFR
jgi:hypothetical protein